MSETLLPVMLKMEGKRVLVVGGGMVALDKVEQLLKCKAKITLVSPELCDELKACAERGEIEYVRGTYDPKLMDDADIVFACTDDNEVNKRVSDDAQARKLQVNVVDVPDLCTFYMPAILRRGGLVLAISTTGASPALARHIRLFLEDVFGEEYADLIDLLAELRPELKEKIAGMADRREFVKRVWESEALTLIRQGKREEARELIRQCMSPSSV